MLRTDVIPLFNMFNVVFQILNEFRYGIFYLHTKLTANMVNSMDLYI